MILSLYGTLSVFAAYAKILTIASFLGIGVNTTKTYATHPLVKVLLLYVFAYSVINDKLACLFAVALFTVVEVREFVQDAKEEVEDFVITQQDESGSDAGEESAPDETAAQSGSGGSGDTQQQSLDDEPEENLL